MERIKVETLVNRPISDIWKYWTLAPHIREWYTASDDWWVPCVDQSFVVGGYFKYKLSLRDNSTSFDFKGQFSRIIKGEVIEYILDDSREVITRFKCEDEGVRITQEIDPDKETSEEEQAQGWQAVLDHFKLYSEADHMSFRVTKVMPSDKEMLWDYLTKLDKYIRWAYVFSDGSRFEGDWKKDHYIRFIDPSSGGTKVHIDELEELEKIFMTHEALITQEGKEEVTSDQAKIWIGTKEKYQLRTLDNGSELSVCIRSHHSFVDFLRDSWENAMSVMKEKIEDELHHG